MSSEARFEEDPPPRRPWRAKEAPAQLVLDLEGFEGPIDVLLQLAREQKVDVTRISILDLAEQYLEFVREARRLRLELAADYLVMAAWLAYLKSRLLLPEPQGGEDEPSGAEMAAALSFQLQRLQAVQEAGARLMARPRLGRDVFPRGMPEALPVTTTVGYEASLYDLLRAYARLRRDAGAGRLRIDPMDLMSVEAALQRLRRRLGAAPDWHTLASFLPGELDSSLQRRSALASTFAASLELVREGQAELRQDDTYGPILVRARRPRPAEAGTGDPPKENGP